MKAQYDKGGDEDIETWSLKFKQPPLLLLVLKYTNFWHPLLAQQFFQSPPFQCLKIFLEVPPSVSSNPPSPYHIKWTFPKLGGQTA